MYYNIPSLLSTVDELRAVSEATKPDAFALLKTGLTMPNDEFFLSNYRLFRLDRNRCVVTSLFMYVLFFHVVYHCKVDLVD